MQSARHAGAKDLGGLLELFRASEVSPLAEPDAAVRIWAEMLAREGVVLFVSEADDGRIAATCMLVTAPNLLREGRGLGYLDNVVTHPEFRGRGHGRAVVRAALSEAWANNCYHVLLQSGRKDPRVQRFYESCGFEPGLRTSYVAKNPAESGVAQ